MSVPPFPLTPWSTVTWRRAHIFQDGADLNQNPDWRPVVGTTLTLRPSITGMLVYNQPNGDKVTINIQDVKCTLDSNGYLVTSDGRPVYIAATDDPNMSVQGWTWSIVELSNIRFSAPSGGEVDISDFVMAPAVDQTKTWVERIPELVATIDGAVAPALDAAARAEAAATSASTTAAAVDAAVNLSAENSAFGNSAQQSITTGNFNSAVGASAQESLTTGLGNSAVGASAQQSLTTGRYNSAYGSTSQEALTTGWHNNAVGFSAQRGLTTGQANNAIGSSAQRAPRGQTAWATTTASHQTSIGHGSGQGSAAQSDDITTVGYNSVADGTKATALGSTSAAMHAGSVAIGSDTTTTALGQVAVGERDVEIQSSDKGLVLQSPDGSRWRATITDTGTPAWFQLTDSAGDPVNSYASGLMISGPGRPDDPGTTRYTKAELDAMPEGTIYRSTDKPQGTLLWRRVEPYPINWATSANWVCIEGDTGWINVDQANTWINPVIPSTSIFSRVRWKDGRFMWRGTIHSPGTPADHGNSLGGTFGLDTSGVSAFEELYFDHMVETPVFSANNSRTEAVAVATTIRELSGAIVTIKYPADAKAQFSFMVDRERYNESPSTPHTPWPTGAQLNHIQFP